MFVSGLPLFSANSRVVPLCFLSLSRTCVIKTSGRPSPPCCHSHTLMKSFKRKSHVAACRQFDSSHMLSQVASGCKRLGRLFALGRSTEQNRLSSTLCYTRWRVVVIHVVRLASVTHKNKKCWHDGGLNILLPKTHKMFTVVDTNVSVVLKAIRCCTVQSFYAREFLSVGKFERKIHHSLRQHLADRKTDRPSMLLLLCTMCNEKSSKYSNSVCWGR